MNSKTPKLLLIAFLLSLGTSCAVKVPSGSPGKSGTAPGKVKKTTGDKSAKKHAPGQKKK